MSGLLGVLDYINNNELVVILLSAAIFAFTEFTKFRNKAYVKVKDPRVREALRRKKIDLDELNKQVFVVMLCFSALCLVIMIIQPVVGFFVYILLSRFISNAAIGPLVGRTANKK